MTCIVAVRAKLCTAARFVSGTSAGGGACRPRRGTDALVLRSSTIANGKWVECHWGLLTDLGFPTKNDHFHSFWGTPMLSHAHIDSWPAWGFTPAHLRLAGFFGSLVDKWDESSPKNAKHNSCITWQSHRIRLYGIYAKPFATIYH